jgi:hypothetical protein
MAASLVSWSNEWVVRQSLASKGLNTETGKAKVLKTVMRRQSVKTQQTEDT